MMVVKTCCGCIDLHKGVVVIGSLSLIWAILTASTMIFHVSQMENLEENYSRLMLLKTIIVTLLIYVSYGAVFAVLMITGSFRKIAGYFVPWLALGFTGVVVSVSIIFAFIIVTCSKLPAGVFLGFVISMMAAAGLKIYLWLVVYSYYKEVIAQKYGHQTRPNHGKILSQPTKNPYWNI